jgi:4-amino-4-deoxy-L-arabinose transferase-like glycosyltransferase
MFYLAKLGQKISFLALAVIITISAIFMLNAASKESAIMDELAHIPAGYSYDRFLDYRLNPEHPPLVKALSAIPLLFLNLNFPLDSSSWEKDVNGQWDVGNQFIYKINDNKADKIIFLSRIFPIILTLLLILCVYLWSKKLVGPLWALVPTFFVALSPNIIAHGHYVTTDIGATLGFIIGLWSYSSYLQKQTKKSLILAGVAFGFSQLLKFSTFLLIPLFLFFSLVNWWFKSHQKELPIFSKNSLKILLKNILNLLVIFFIGYLLVWLVYIIFTINYPLEKQVSDTESILKSFAGGPDPQWRKCPPYGIGMRCLANIDIWMSSIPIIRGLAQYLLGVLMVIQRSAGGNTAYFLGDISGAGWWYYFPIVYLLKEPIPSLILVALGIFLAVRNLYHQTKEKRTNRFYNYLYEKFDLFAILSTAIFYWLYSIKSTLNIGFRHILPTIPLLYILATVSIKNWIDNQNQNERDFPWYQKILSSFKDIVRKSLKITLVVFLLVWLFAETIIASPYFLSYFNQIGKGVWGGYQYVTDSNYDWGQDLKRLKIYVQKNNIDKIAVDYFGGGDVSYYLSDKAVLWWSSKGNPLNEGVKWIAISANVIQSAKANPTKGYVLEEQNTYPWLNQKPYARAGTSIFIYKLE